MSARSVQATAYARAGLLGNPSDGYGGKAIALCLGDFRARAHVESANRFELRPGAGDGLAFGDLRAAAQHFERAGCDDGMRLQRAAVRRFCTWWQGLAELDAGDPRLRLSLRYETDIPRQVGLAGSSAIVIATLRALARWFGVSIPPFELAELALAAELEDLGIAAGAMDRVIQSYGGLMAMELREPRREAGYRRLDPADLPQLFLAWDRRGGQSSGRAHGDLRARWLRGDRDVLEEIEVLRGLVDAGVECLARKDGPGLAALIDRNFESRLRIFGVSERDREMVELARAHGASAKLCGSGGAVIGVPGDSTDWAALASAFDAVGVSMRQPRFAEERTPGASP